MSYTLIEGLKVSESDLQGRPTGVTVGYYTNLQRADVAAKGKGDWGAAGVISTIRLLKLEDGSVFALDYPGIITPDRALKLADRRTEEEAYEALQRQQLADQVWGQLSSKEKAALAAHIERLTK